MNKAKLKLKLRDLNRRIGKLDRAIFLGHGWYPKSLDATKRDRQALDIRRREVRRELKARPVGSGPGVRRGKWEAQ